MKYACPCCGYLTLRKEPPGTYEICPICCWEDSRTDSPYEQSNDATLRQAQRNFIDFGACERGWVSEVRAPSELDERTVGWQALDEREEIQKARVIDLISRAFSGVTRDGGVSLHEADIIDGYGSAEKRVAARKLDTESGWQAVPDRDIEYYNSILSFLDPIGFRYYIAAYMVWSLKNFRISESVTSDFTIYAFAMDGHQNMKDWKMSRFSILSEAQSTAVYEFLRFMQDFGEGDADSSVARQAINQYWVRFSKIDPK